MRPDKEKKSPKSSDRVLSTETSEELDIVRPGMVGRSRGDRYRGEFRDRAKLAMFIGKKYREKFRSGRRIR